MSAVVLSVVFGTLGYVVTYKIQVRRCKRAALAWEWTTSITLSNWKKTRKLPLNNHNPVLMPFVTKKP